MMNIKFSTPRIDYLKFEKTENYDDTGDIEININVSESNVFKSGNNEFFYGISIVISGDEAPFKLELHISADFVIDEVEAENVQDILKKEGVNLLISYARPIISTITMQSGLPPFEIPYMNL